jgi:hypothetical protein
MTQIQLGFVPDPVMLGLDQIMPSRKITEGLILSRKFKQIVASIDAVGLIEPLTVCKAEKNSGTHILLDGHLRVCALRDLGFRDAPCLIATDDESYTYNNRVNRLSTIQEHIMLRRAVQRGVTPDRLAKALAVNITNVMKKLNLLDGICAEAVTLLKDQQFSANIGAVLRKMKPTRQIECVELMVATNNITLTYAQALLAATPITMLANEAKVKKIPGVTPEQMSRMEREMGNLQGRFKAIEQSYGQDVLNLVLAKGYLVKLLGNKAVVRFLNQNQPDVFREFTSIAETGSLDP